MPFAVIREIIRHASGRSRQCRQAGTVLAACLAAWSSGCALFETATATATQTSALSTLTNWFSQPIETAPGIDLDSIKPDSRPAALVPENLLEITVWDLYEPGKPYSFPVRVSERQTIEVPFLGEVPVEGQGLPELETRLVDGFRHGEYLLNPRVLIRSLDPPVIKVQVTGAVNRSGFCEVSRSEASVYAAVVSAGGLKKTASAQVGLTRRRAVPVRDAERAQTVDDLAAKSSLPAPAPGEQRPAALRANSNDEVSVSAVSSEGRGIASGPSLVEGQRADHSPDGRNRALPRAIDEETVWYDTSRAPDREHLKTLRLVEGDVVTVKAAAQPLRVGGIVNNPGSYPLPAGRSLNVWQAIELAGGIREENVPFNITLMRPAAEGRSARRWSLNVPGFDQHPASSPSVEPGDVLHVESTAGSRIRRAVGDLWNKP